MQAANPFHVFGMYANFLLPSLCGSRLVWTFPDVVLELRAQGKNHVHASAELAYKTHMGPYVMGWSLVDSAIVFYR